MKEYHLRLITGLWLAFFILTGVFSLPFIAAEMPTVSGWTSDPDIQAIFLRQVADMVMVSTWLLITALMIFGARRGWQG